MVVVGSDHHLWILFFLKCLRSKATKSESISRFVKDVNGGGRVRHHLRIYFFKCLPK